MKSQYNYSRPREACASGLLIGQQMSRHVTPCHVLLGVYKRVKAWPPQSLCLVVFSSFGVWARNALFSWNIHSFGIEPLILSSSSRLSLGIYSLWSYWIYRYIVVSLDYTRYGATVSSSSFRVIIRHHRQSVLRYHHLSSLPFRHRCGSAVAAVLSRDCQHR